MNENEIINRYLKVPYLCGGMDPTKGLNCWGLVKAIYRDLEIPLVDFVDYVERYPIQNQDRLIEFYQDALKEVERPDPFDVVLLSVDGYLHAGVVLSGRRFIHVCRAGMSICSLGNPLWRSKILGYYRSAKYA
jgi:cell wall-associated NlpC family hydrolase